LAQKDYLIALGIWLAYVSADFLYRLLGKYVLAPKMGEYAAHIIGVVILIGLVVAFSYMFVKSVQIQSCNRSDFLFIGILWFMLSATITIGYSRYIGEDNWEPFLKEIDISRGGLRGLVLLAELVVPFIVGTIRLNRHFKRRRRRSYRT